MQDVYGVGLKEPKEQSMEGYDRSVLSFRCCHFSSYPARQRGFVKSTASFILDKA